MFDFDPQGGFAALKYFKLKDKQSNKDKHFLLIAGGIGSDQNVSSKVQIISFSATKKGQQISFINVEIYEQEPL